MPTLQDVTVALIAVGFRKLHPTYLLGEFLKKASHL